MLAVCFFDYITGMRGLSFPLQLSTLKPSGLTSVHAERLGILYSAVYCLLHASANQLCNCSLRGRILQCDLVS